jgi:hypothetical protein
MFQNQGGSYSDIGQWYSLESFSSLGAAMTQTAEFKLTTVKTSTTIHFKEEDLPKHKPKPMKLPAFPAAFAQEN